LMNVGASDAQPKALGAGKSLRPVTVTPTPASNPVTPTPALSAAAPAQTGGGDPSTEAPSSGGGLRGALNGALDNPLLYIGLGLMASKNPSILGAIGEGVSGGIGMYSQRQMDKSKMGLSAAKDARDADFERQKIAIQQAEASGKLTAEQARLKLAEAAGVRADAAAAKPTSLQERVSALRAAGGSKADELRMLRGANAQPDDEDKRQKFVQDWVQKNPGADPSEGYDLYDQIAAGGASTNDLMKAAGF